MLACPTRHSATSRASSAFASRELTFAGKSDPLRAPLSEENRETDRNFERSLQMNGFQSRPLSN